MQFLKSGFKWGCGIIAFLLFLCNCIVIYSALYDSNKAAVVNDAESDIQTINADEAVDYAALNTTDSGQNSTTENKEKYTDILEEPEVNPALQFDKDDWKLILVNKIHRIPEDYTFETGYVNTSKGKMPCDERIADDLSAMLEDADKEGIRLIIVSPYRSISHQKYLFNRKLRGYMKQGESYLSAYYKTAQIVTIPGTSEHQIGLAMDITSEKYYYLNEYFGETEAGIWLSDNCWKYGFIVRYPQGKENITGIEYEPWHFRYVGKDAAKYITEEGLCLEEFIELLDK